MTPPLPTVRAIQQFAHSPPTQQIPQRVITDDR
jgi:hypothetical protein